MESTNVPFLPRRVRILFGQRGEQPGPALSSPRPENKKRRGDPRQRHAIVLGRSIQKGQRPSRQRNKGTRSPRSIEGSSCRVPLDDPTRGVRIPRWSQPLERVSSERHPTDLAVIERERASPLGSNQIKMKEKGRGTDPTGMSMRRGRSPVIPPRGHLARDTRSRAT
jgi:hypothetical protein